MGSAELPSTVYELERQVGEEVSEEKIEGGTGKMVSGQPTEEGSMPGHQGAVLVMGFAHEFQFP